MYALVNPSSTSVLYLGGEMLAHPPLLRMATSSRSRMLDQLLSLTLHGWGVRLRSGGKGKGSGRM